jgi:hypothetical protein
MKTGPLLLFLAVTFTPLTALAEIHVYGAWHCGNDYCTWGTARCEHGVGTGARVYAIPIPMPPLRQE